MSKVPEPKTSDVEIRQLFSRAEKAVTSLGDRLAQGATEFSKTFGEALSKTEKGILALQEVGSPKTGVDLLARALVKFARANGVDDAFVLDRVTLHLRRNRK